MRKLLLLASALLLLFCPPAYADPAIFARGNLVAWCIVPFDAKKRGAEERAQMLQRLGIQRLAYDWRAEHIPTFQDEIAACRRHHIEITAWWFPSTLNDEARAILDVLEKNRLKTQLWVAMDTPPDNPGSRPRVGTRVRSMADRLRPIAEAAARIGCTVGLYNHGGWFGEPENQIAILGALGVTNAGIVYNFHHGHDHIDRFAQLFPRIQPHLLAVNLNGMVHNADAIGKKILTIGAGDSEFAMLKVISDSGWHGPVGIIDHRHETDSEETLRENLAGLEKLAQKLRP